MAVCQCDWFSGSVAVGNSDTTLARLRVNGVLQSSQNPNPSAPGVIPALFLTNDAAEADSGGMLVFGTGSAKFASVMGSLTNVSNNTTGHLLVHTRNAATDVALTERVRITDQGRVGINNAAPQARLHVNGTLQHSNTPNVNDPNVTPSLVLTNDAAGLDYGGMVVFGAGQGRFAAIKGSMASAGGSMTGHLVICTRATDGSPTLTERMRITAGGAVGIGTTDPQNALEVVGAVVTQALNASATTLLRAQAPDFASSFRAVGVAYSSAGAGGTGTLGLLNSNLGQVLFQNTANAVIATNNGAPLVFGTNNSERLRVTPSGDVGIGTGGPLARLHVVGTTVLSGSVGIWTVPEETLDVAGTVRATGTVRVGDYTGATPREGRLRLATTDGGSAARTWDIAASYLSSGNLAFKDGHMPQPALVIQATSGNVGIGTANPTTRLEFASDVDAQLIRFKRSDGTNAAGIGATEFGKSLTFSTKDVERVRIHEDGNVGIGNQSPAHKLDVTGNVHATGTLMANGNVNATVDVNVGNNLTVTNSATVEGDLTVRSAIRAGDPWRKIADGNGCYYA